MQVYISHAHADAKLAKRIAAVLRDSGLQVWDDTQIVPGDNPGEKLGEALEGSNAMVVLLTPNSARAPHLRYETEYALVNRKFKGRLIPVIAALPGQIPPDQIPWVFSKLHTIYLADPENDEAGLQEIAEALKTAA